MKKRTMFFLLILGTFLLVGNTPMKMTLSNNKVVYITDISKEYPLEKLKLNGKEWLEKKYDLLDEYFGKSESFKISTGSADEQYKKCYISSKKGDNTLVLFFSGAMGGYGNYTDGVDIYLNKNDFPSLEKCIPSKFVNKNMTFTNGLMLNIDSKKVKKILGDKTTYEDKEIFVYSFNVPISLKGKDGKEREFDRFRSFEIHFTENKVSKIYLRVGDVS